MWVILLSLCFVAFLKVPPSFIITPRNQTVKENERATFTCSATGNPTPQITWIKDGLTVGTGKNLTFTASRNDSGKYQCLITNGLTAGIQESVDLDVHCEYKRISFHNGRVC